MINYECNSCHRIISDEEKVYNNDLCNECLLQRKNNYKFIWNEINNIDEILESKRCKLCKVNDEKIGGICIAK